jgi:hypothetical protein
MVLFGDSEQNVEVLPMLIGNGLELAVFIERYTYHIVAVNPHSCGVYSVVLQILKMGFPENVIERIAAEIVPVIPRGI